MSMSRVGIKRYLVPSPSGYNRGSARCLYTSCLTINDRQVPTLHSCAHRALLRNLSRSSTRNAAPSVRFQLQPLPTASLAITTHRHGIPAIIVTRQRSDQVHSEENRRSSVSHHRSTSSLDDILKQPMIMSVPQTAVRLANCSQKLPSVTRILKMTKSAESERALALWEKKMVAKLGTEGFVQYQTDMFKRGHDLHANLEKLMLGKPPDEVIWGADVKGYWNSFRNRLAEFKNTVVTEAKVTHSVLEYSGILDCVTHHKGTLCVAEWKTSERKKTRLEDTYDNPIQLAAYIGAWNIMHPDKQIENAVLVILYQDGTSCNLLTLGRESLEFYWTAWLLRLRLYFQEKLDEPQW